MPLAFRDGLTHDLQQGFQLTCQRCHLVGTRVIPFDAC